MFFFARFVLFLSISFRQRYVFTRHRVVCYCSVGALLVRKKVKHTQRIDTRLQRDRYQVNHQHMQIQYNEATHAKTTGLIIIRAIKLPHSFELNRWMNIPQRVKGTMHRTGRASKSKQIIIETPHKIEQQNPIETALNRTQKKNYALESPSVRIRAH